MHGFCDSTVKLFLVMIASLLPLHHDRAVKPEKTAWSSSFTCNVVSNIAFKSAVHSSGHLSKKAKFILMKSPWQRKEDEMKVCQLKISHVACE